MSGCCTFRRTGSQTNCATRNPGEAESAIVTGDVGLRPNAVIAKAVGVDGGETEKEGERN